MTAYWAQWESSDLDSWQGKDWADDEIDTDLSHDESDTDSYQEEEECCSGCMVCLGMSERDFM